MNLFFEYLIPSNWSIVKAHGANTLQIGANGKKMNTYCQIIRMWFKFFEY